MIRHSFIQYLTIAFPTAQVHFITHHDSGFVRIILKRHSEKHNRIVESIWCVSFGVLVEETWWATIASALRHQFDYMEGTDEETGGTEGVRGVRDEVDPNGEGGGGT